MTSFRDLVEKITDLGEGNPLDRLRDFDKTRVAVGKKGIFSPDEQGDDVVIKRKDGLTTRRVSHDDYVRVWKDKGWIIAEGFWKDAWHGTKDEKRQERQDRDSYKQHQVDKLTNKLNKKSNNAPKVRRDAYRKVHGEFDEDESTQVTEDDLMEIGNFFRAVTDFSRDRRNRKIIKQEAKEQYKSWLQTYGVFKEKTRGNANAKSPTAIKKAFQQWANHAFDVDQTQNKELSRVVKSFKGSREEMFPAIMKITATAVYQEMTGQGTDQKAPDPSQAPQSQDPNDAGELPVDLILRALHKAGTGGKLTGQEQMAIDNIAKRFGDVLDSPDTAKAQKAIFNVAKQE